MGLKNSKFAQGVMQRLPAILTGKTANLHKA